MLGAARTAQIAGWATPAPPAPVTNPVIGFTKLNTVSTQTGIKKFGSASMLVGGTSGLDCIRNTSGSYDFWPSGTGDFTIQWWQYIPTAVTGGYMEFCSNEETSGGLSLRFGSNYGASNFDSINIFARGQADLNYYNYTWVRDTWQFVSVTRSGTNVYVHVDGVSIAQSGGSGAGTRNFVATSGLNKVEIGRAGDTGLRGVYIDDFQVFQSTAKYTNASYAVPTAQAILTTGTTLLLNMNGANNGISFPNAVSNSTPTDPYYSNVTMLLSAQTGAVKDMSSYLSTITTVQSPGGVASTTQTLYNPYSIYNAASTSGSRFKVAANSERQASGVFTFEVWMWSSAAGNNFNAPWCPSNNASNAGFTNGSCGNSKSGRMSEEFTQSYTNYYVSNNSIHDSTWHHFAMVRDTDNVIRFYWDGVQAAATRSSTATIDFGAYDWMVGGYNNLDSDNRWVGYMDDMRLTNGVARYTANFTPPTTAFPTI